MSRPISFRLSRVALCVALALGSGPALAQTTTSAVAGRVVAADGKPVTGAEVTITHVETGSTSRITTDAEGRYQARGLRPGGPYTITITRDGQVEKRENVYLTLAETTALDVRMGSAGRETITVSAASINDKFASTTMGAETQIGPRELAALPSIQRNLQDYARLDPRLSQTDMERG